MRVAPVVRLLTVVNDHVKVEDAVPIFETVVAVTWTAETLVMPVGISTTSMVEEFFTVSIKMLLDDEPS